MSEDAISAALRTDRTIDITTTGAKSGEPRTIEIWFHNLNGELFICGTPGGPKGPGHRHPRGWLANLVAHPEFVFHLKESVQADIPARAKPVTDSATRRRFMSAPSTRWYRDQGYSVDELVNNAPIVALQLDVDKAVVK
ncbi:MAG: nitroreductase family deazaflavin-dependent oxidoreductase [Pseudomonadales bacterium]|nr:nitroreductase family deazaflavin-dependent oxidoreductase [Pseudomonadales bacterium]MCP5184033.1 nitroreductase family deazaflavin-dependent oxidoreductase [Pseudomonadales bacterium]